MKKRQLTIALCVLLAGATAVTWEMFRARKSQSSKPLIPFRTRLFQDLDLWTVRSPDWNLSQGLLGGLPALLEEGFEEGLPEDLFLHLAPTSLTKTERTLREDCSPSSSKPAFTSAEAAIEGKLGLRFEQPVGAAVCIVPVKPHTPYFFQAMVRRPDMPHLPRDEEGSSSLPMDPASARDALVGEIMILEMRRKPDLHGKVDLRAAVEAGKIVASHLLSDSLDSMVAMIGDSWAAPESQDFRDSNAGPQSLVFRTTRYTKFLAIALMAGNPGWWCWEDSSHEGSVPPQASVDFDSLRLLRLPLRRYLALETETGESSDQSIDSTLVHAAAIVREVPITADMRLGLLAPPATRAEVPLQLPQGPFRITASCGVLEEYHETWGQSPMEFRLAVLTKDQSGESTTLSAAKTLAPAHILDDRCWQDLSLQGTGHGETATLVLETSTEQACADVGVFSEPHLLNLSAETSPTQRNVLIISLDTLRADHLGCYGYTRPDGLQTSPRLDEFAKKCWVFDRARATAPYTLPSHATLFTGLYPTVHGVVDKDRRLVSGIHPLMAEEFAKAGYRTVAFTAGGFVSYEYGFHQGFDQYSILDPLLTMEDRFRNVFPFPGDRESNDVAFAAYDRRAIEKWVLNHHEEPFFLFIHSYLVHNYHPPKALEELFLPTGPDQIVGHDRDLQRIELNTVEKGIAPPASVIETLTHLYDATIRAADDEIGALLDFLDAQGILENTIVCLTSDHGEEFGEHGGLVHGRTLYEEMQHVPLLLHLPEESPRRVSTPVDLADVAPTLLAAAGLKSELDMDGRDLRSRINNDAFNDTGWAEVNARSLAELYAVYSGPWKLLYAPTASTAKLNRMSHRPEEWQLFHLERDPKEQHNLLAQPQDTQPPAFQLLQLKLQEWHARLAERGHVLVGSGAQLESQLSPEAAEQLRALGYALDDS